MPDARCQMPDARCQMPDARCPSNAWASSGSKVQFSTSSVIPLFVVDTRRLPTALSRKASSFTCDFPTQLPFLHTIRQLQRQLVPENPSTLQTTTHPAFVQFHQQHRFLHTFHPRHPFLHPISAVTTHTCRPSVPVTLIPNLSVPPDSEISHSVAPKPLDTRQGTLSPILRSPCFLSKYPSRPWCH
jgi:hypothetical protein